MQSGGVRVLELRAFVGALAHRLLGVWRRLSLSIWASRLIPEMGPIWQHFEAGNAHKAGGVEGPAGGAGQRDPIGRAWCAGRAGEGPRVAWRGAGRAALHQNVALDPPPQALRRSELETHNGDLCGPIKV